MSDHVFVCYSRKDEDFVLKLAANLKRLGVPIWLDQWDIPTGANWSRTIESALKECARLLIVLTPSSVESDEVQSEWLSALDREKIVVPILYEQCQMPFRLKPIQYIDFTSHSPDDKEALEKILKALGMNSAPDIKIQGEDKEVIRDQDRAALEAKSQNNSISAGSAELHIKSNEGLFKKGLMVAVPLIILISLIAFFAPTKPDIETERITFDAFPDGIPITGDIILRGDEFSAKGVLLAGSPESSYCNDAKSVAIHGPESMYNLYFPSSSSIFIINSILLIIFLSPNS